MAGVDIFITKFCTNSFLLVAMTLGNKERLRSGGQKSPDDWVTYQFLLRRIFQKLFLFFRSCISNFNDKYQDEKSKYVIRHENIFVKKRHFGYCNKTSYLGVLSYSLPSKEIFHWEQLPILQIKKVNKERAMDPLSWYYQ